MAWMIFIKILKNKIQIKNENNKQLNSLVTEFFIRGRKLSTSLVFITQSYFTVPKKIKLNSAHNFVMKIPNKKQRQ